MLKNIKYNDVCQKFNRGINRINNEEVIDIAITSFGGFTDAFENGVGRRVQLKENECQLSVNTVAQINNKMFHFVRCYTNYQLDTKDLDKKQDIVKYANELDKNIEDKKTILPLIAYYNNCTEFECDCSTNNLNSRSFGYSNCLIVKNKFGASKQFYKMLSYMCWQKRMMNIDDNFTKFYQIAVKNICKGLDKIGFNGFVYDPIKDLFFVSKNKTMIQLSNISKDNKIFFAILFDLNMRCLMLNPHNKSPFKVEGCVGITYKFEKNNLLTTLSCLLSKQFSKIQILI